mmetsp:Transcript_102236/g.289534  ORF Transcript_102236/g.289534 Transcript_102236/m.289534 type:complete len:201 (+) Transcript_102236:808-1410(+)
MGGLVAVALAHHPPAMLAGNDVGGEVRVRLGVHALPDVRAELHEEDLPAVVGVHLVELLHDLRLRELQPQLAQPPAELVDVHPAVVTVDGVEYPEELVEPEDVQDECVEFLLLDPVVPVTIHKDGLLVRAHQRWLVVEPSGPCAAGHQLDHHFVYLCKAHDVVAIVVEPLPQFLQLRPVVQAQLVHLPVHRHPQLHELVV